ncbi:hypothetical protein MTY66_00050 [Mycolicibacterium sp. TY66]|uniref:hypothetical protein n=1 Tax=unclassified Mycolicibacterium TaxID=2636767 RepID=UPI001BB34C1F|nr:MULTISPECIES: hypothetical protein [unclassified Mycolicibacterium]BCI78380.1 hypothetical protein MTY66_00050 [Mycolicibacterium sp. TY66]BCJ83958.1 hypothetical protein MTY81_53310 [Mycolicibacterium sp. TY81]
MDKRRRTEADYEAAAADYEANPPTADEVRSIEFGPGLPGERLTDADYTELAADYAANPVRSDEVIDPVRINPAHLRPGSSDADSE